MTNSMVEWYGGSTAPWPIDGTTYPIGAPFLMSQYAWNYRRIWQFQITAAPAPYVQLPDARDIPTGAEIFFLIGTVATIIEIVILDAAGTRVGAIPGLLQRKAIVCLLDNTTAAGQWAVLVGSAGAFIVTT